MRLSLSPPQSSDGDKNNAASLAGKQEKPYINARICAYIYRGE